MCIEKTLSLSYQDLMGIKLKAQRNGNWRRLAEVERALYKASTELAKLRGKIVSPSLIETLRTIISKLLQTAANRAIQFGRERAKRLLELYSRNGVLKWLPAICNMLDDPNYLLWLGVTEMTMRSIGILIV